jgi:hypothetical protein
MGLLERFQSLFGRGPGTDVRFVLHLNAASKGGLAKSLDRLGPLEQGYITDTAAANLFGSPDKYPHRFDAAAFTALGDFAAAHRCAQKRVRWERRVYFWKQRDLGHSPANDEANRT